MHIFYCWHFCFQRPGWWKQVDAASQDICGATKGGVIFFDCIIFLFFSGRDKEQIWLAVFSTGSLSVFIRRADFLLQHRFVQLVKRQSFDIGVPGHSSTESETVQSWFSGESAFNFSLLCFYLFFSVLLICRSLLSPFPFKITWFCGTSEACRTLGHPESIPLAIANIERDFVVVGVLEEVKTLHSSLKRKELSLQKHSCTIQNANCRSPSSPPSFFPHWSTSPKMEKTIVVMECLMPEFLTGLRQLWATNQVTVK